MGLKRYSANARLLCGAATGLAMMATAMPAVAQDTQTEDVAEDDGNVIIVSGIRASIETSLDAKREANSIVEVISAEDIGQLPDLSIADSLARLPGPRALEHRAGADPGSGLKDAVHHALLADIDGQVGAHFLYHLRHQPFVLLEEGRQQVFRRDLRMRLRLRHLLRVRDGVNRSLSKPVHVHISSPA